MLTPTTMVRAGVAIRGGLTWPSVYTHGRGALLVNQAQCAGNAALPGNSIAAGRLPGNALGWLHPGWVGTLRDESPFIRRYLEQPTWRIWLDVVGLLTAALLFAHWGL
jgi:hypothetical protein